MFTSLRLILLPAFFSAASLYAQPAFLKNPDIVWAAEFQQDWVIDLSSFEQEFDFGVTTLKLLRTRRSNGFASSPYLADLVFEAVFRKELPVFRDPDCKTVLDIEHIYPSRDTILEFDPETYAEKRVITFVEPWPFYDFKAWRLRQILAYNAKTANWDTVVEAIAPLVLIKNERGDSIGIRPLFWFKPDNERQDLSDKHITWAKGTMNKQEKTQISIDSGLSLKVIDGFQNPLAHMLQVVEKDMKTPIYNNLNEKLLTPAERMAIRPAPIDTISQFDPETYEEKKVVVHNNPDIERFHELRLIQTWYWDDQRKRLSICLDAIAPLQEHYDESGNLKFKSPLFYQRTRK